MGKMSEVSDGYHTFGELYEHRAALTALVLQANQHLAWRSMKHHDGTMFDDETFIVGMDIPGIGQISYHYNVRDWALFHGIRTLDFAPEYDGHTAHQVNERLRLLAIRRQATL